LSFVSLAKCGLSISQEGKLTTKNTKRVFVHEGHEEGHLQEPATAGWIRWAWSGAEGCPTPALYIFSVVVNPGRYRNENG
jgi:hypothetical protein